MVISLFILPIAMLLVGCLGFFGFFQEYKDEGSVIGLPRNHFSAEYGPVFPVPASMAKDWDACVNFGTDAGFPRTLFVKFRDGRVVEAKAYTD